MHQIPTELIDRHDYRVPHYIARSVADINFELLAEQGITNVLLDVDNTLVTFGAKALHTRVAPVLAAARAAGYIKRLGIASNSRRDLTFLRHSLRPDIVMQSHGLVIKPRREFFIDALSRLGATPETTVMIGDKLVQDIWGARKVGLMTVLVRPLGHDAWFDQLLMLRWQERWLLNRYLPQHREHWF